MTFTPPPTLPQGQAVLSTKTALALLGGLIAFFLPRVLEWAGIPAAQQPEAIALLSQIGTPLGLVLGIFFRAAATKKVTHIFPKIGGSGPGPATLASILALFLVVGVFSAPLGGCATKPLIPPSLEVVAAQGDTSVDLAYNIAARAYKKQLPTMDPATKATVKPLLLDAYKLVAAIDAGEVLGNSQNMADQIGKALALIGQAKAALHVQ